MLGVGRFVLELFRGNVSPRPARGPSVRGRLHGVGLRRVRPRALRGGCAPWAPLDPDTVSHCASSQLSTTLSAPKSRSMSRAHGTPLLAALIGKPHAVLNSSSTRPCGLNSVAIA